MAKASEKSESVQCEAGRRKVDRVMEEFERGELMSSSGSQVTSRSQALAIALSEGRRVCED